MTEGGTSARGRAKRPRAENLWEPTRFQKIARSCRFFTDFCSLKNIETTTKRLPEQGRSFRCFPSAFLSKCFQADHACDLHEYLAESGALYFTSLHLREGCARFTLSQHIRPMVANHDLFHFRGHVMLQWRKSSHFEARIARIYSSIEHEVENETSKLQFFCEENLWTRYDAYIILTAIYASICYTARLS